jgi:hypothetical protein
MEFNGAIATVRPSNLSWHMRRGSGGKKVAIRETSGSVIIIKLRAEGAHTSSKTLSIRGFTSGYLLAAASRPIPKLTLPNRLSIIESHAGKASFR